MDNQITTLAKWWIEAPYRVVFTGAGMSTEAGLPDFRSKEGLWKKQDPRKLASIDALLHNTEDFYDFYRNRFHGLSLASPHNGHKILAKLEKDGLLNSIITQNVDGLHDIAGSNRVIELHGNLRKSECISCHVEYKTEKLLEKDIPKCDKCEGLLKPGIILFGEMLPQEALQQADIESRRAHLFIVIGSSLEVSPANYFPLKARDKGAKLVFINLDNTDMDEMAHLIIRGKAGEVLENLYGEIRRFLVETAIE